MAPGASQVPVQVVLLGTLVPATQRSPAFSFSLALPQGERRLARGQQSFRGLFPGGGLGSSRFISSLGRTQRSLSQRPSPESSPAVLLLSSLGLRALRRRPRVQRSAPRGGLGAFPSGRAAAAPCPAQSPRGAEYSSPLSRARKHGGVVFLQPDKTRNSQNPIHFHVQKWTVI